MTAPDARQPNEKWRIGTSWGIHVYQGEKGSPGERPVATFHDPADAQRAVDAVNAADDRRRNAMTETDRPTPKRCPECGAVMDPTKAWWWTAAGAADTENCARLLVDRDVAMETR